METPPPAAPARVLSALGRRLAEVLGADLRSLAVGRVGLGLLVLADLAARAGDLQAHYTDFGLLPRGVLLSKFSHGLAVCLHLISGTAAGQCALFAAQGLLAAALVVGWRTRTACALSWLGIYSLHVRNPVVLQGGDDLLRMLLFWGMFMPLGARYSVDAALSDADAGPGREARAPGPVLCVGSVALLVQLLLMYLGTALLKTGREWHAEASAVYYALHFDQLALPLATVIRGHYRLTQVLTRLTIGWETFGPLFLVCPLYFGPLRTFGVAAFIGMHHGFALCLMLGLFPWIDAVSMLLLLPGWFWQRAARLLPAAAQRQLTVYYDRDCQLCRKLCFVLRELLVLPHVALLPDSASAVAAEHMRAARSWVAIDARGAHTAWQAFVALLRVSPWARLLAPLAARPAPARLGRRIYYALATRRAQLGPYAATLWPWRRAAPLRGWLSGGLAAAALALVVTWNLAAWPRSRVVVPPGLRPLAYMFRLDQDWGMFAPFPQKEDGWYVMAGSLDDGTPYDVWRNRPGEVSVNKPESVALDAGNQRWSKYLMNIWMARNADYRLYFGQYLCRRANGVGTPRTAKSLARFDIAFYSETTLPEYRSTPPTRTVLWSHYCFGPARPQG